MEWENYYKKTGARPPRDTLVFALDRFDEELGDDDRHFAIDLGCGNGRDTVEILRRSWDALAVDAEHEAISALTERLDEVSRSRLQFHTGRFEELDLPNSDLVNSSFALPLVDPPLFPDLWDQILMSVRSEGRIACQLYGDRDSWVDQPGITFFTKPGVEALIEPLNVEYFNEEEADGITPRGNKKHWHIFHIVAKLP